MAGKIRADIIQGDGALRLNIGETTIISVNASAYNIAQPLNVQTTSTFTDAATFDGAVTVSGAATLGSATVSGAATLGSATVSGAALFNSTTEFKAGIDIQQVIETANVSAIEIGGDGTSVGNTTFDVLEGAVKYHTANVANNWTLNVRGNSTVMLDSVMSTGNTLSLSYIASQNATNTFYQTNMEIDGNAVTPKWQGNSAPTAGNADSLDVYSFTIIKTAANTYTVLGSQTQFA
jgi:hypothetical protein